MVSESQPVPILVPVFRLSLASVPNLRIFRIGEGEGVACTRSGHDMARFINVSTLPPPMLALLLPPVPAKFTCRHRRATRQLKVSAPSLC